MRPKPHRSLSTLGSLVILAVAVVPVAAALIDGTNGPDHLSGTGDPDVIRGYGGADTLNGMSAADKLFGGTGPDRLSGGQGVDRLYGQLGADRLFGGWNIDFVSGGAGDDVIRVDGDYRADEVVCGDGVDTVTYDLTLEHEDSIAADCENLIPIGTPTPRPPPAS